GRVPRRPGRRHRRRLSRCLSRSRLRDPPLRLRGRHRGRPRQPARRDGRQSAGRAPRQLRQGVVSRAGVLHALCSHGPDPGPPPDRALRPHVKPGRVVAGLGAAALAALVAPLLSAYPLTLLTQAAIIAILAMSLDVLLGYTGLPSLGHAAYFGVAAY